MLDKWEARRLAQQVRETGEGRNDQAWDLLEGACGSAEEPALENLWNFVEDAPAALAARMVAALVRNPNPMQARSCRRAWRRWLREPDRALWERLRQEKALPKTGEPETRLRSLALGQAPPEELCAGAVDPNVPEHLRAMLVERCAKQGLVPADPWRRVVFLVLTGQTAQYRAADPDGSLLAAAYDDAATGERARLRAAIIAAGDLDLVQVLASRDRDGRVHPEDRAFLVERHAARADWPELWRLAQQLPLADAVAVTRRTHADWLPDDQDGRALYARLLAVPPERLADGLAELAPAKVIRVHPDGRVRRCALSPDGTRLAVVFTQGEQSPNWFLDEYELPTGRRTARHRIDYLLTVSRLLHTGDAVIAEMSNPYEAGTRNSLAQYGGTKRHVFPQGYGGLVGLAHIHGGFAAVDHHGELLVSGPEGGTGGRLTKLRYLLRGDELEAVPPKGFNDPKGVIDMGLRALASDPAARLLAIGGDSLLMVIDQDATRVIARAGAFPVSDRDGTKRADTLQRGVYVWQAVFLGPERLVALCDFSILGCWSLEGSTLTLEAATQLHDASHLTALPQHNLVAALTRVSDEVRRAGLWTGPAFFDATTLRPAAPPPAFQVSSELRTGIWGTLTGGHLAIATPPDILEVHGRYPHPAAALAERPLADLTVTDLETVRQAAGSLPLGAARDVLELLRACLEYRFATEIQLGGQDRVRTSDHDIALG